MKATHVKGIAVGLLLVAVVIAGSLFTSSLWKSEDGKKTGIAAAAPGQMQNMSAAQKALAQEHASKDWKKIPLKMGLWAVFLIVACRAVRAGKFNRQTRKWYYLSSVLLFGVALGSDPSPMGTVKDAIALYAKSGAIFPPRMIALALFLLTVVLANKAICSWGCQFGTLQDLIFRLNRNPKDTGGIVKQYRIPFVVSNSIRVAVFVAFVGVAFTLAFDFIGVIDPFKVFNPARLGVLGVVVLALILGSAFFVYRPWCHLACPFGLVGWALERFSRIKIRVDEDSCTKCLACAKACPSNAMEAIVLKRKVSPDCFSCGTCMDVCPSKSISFGPKLPGYQTRH
jgi:ferredoxin